MGTLMVVVAQPFVQVLLDLLQSGVDLFTESDSIELFLHGRLYSVNCVN